MASALSPIRLQAADCRFDRTPAVSGEPTRLPFCRRRSGDDSSPGSPVARSEAEVCDPIPRPRQTPSVRGCSSDSPTSGCRAECEPLPRGDDPRSLGIRDAAVLASSRLMALVLANLGTACADPAPSWFGDPAGIAAVALRELRGERKRGAALAPAAAGLTTAAGPSGRRRAGSFHLPDSGQRLDASSSSPPGREEFQVMLTTRCSVDRRQRVPTSRPAQDGRCLIPVSLVDTRGRRHRCTP